MDLRLHRPVRRHQRSLQDVSLAALVVACAAGAAGLHLLFILSARDPLFQTDSPTYLVGVVRFLSGQGFDVPIHRTLGYPAFLAAILSLTHSFWAVAIVQHALTLAFAAMAAFVARRHLGAPWGAAWMAGAACAASPPTLIAAHMILTETLFTFVAIGGVLFWLEGEKQARPALAIAGGVCAALATWVRPVGWAWIIALAGSLLLLGGSRSERTRRALGAAACLLSLGIAASINWAYRGFFGLDRFAGVSLVGTAAPWVDLERIGDSRLRAALKPIYEDAGLRERLSDRAWVRSAPGGLVDRAAGVLSDPFALDRELTRLSLQAFARHPIAVVAHQALWGVQIVAERNAVPQIYLGFATNFFAHRGLLLFADATRGYPAARALVSEGPDEARRIVTTLNRLAQQPDDEAARELTSLQRADPFGYAPIAAFYRALTPFVALIRWLPLMALVSSLILLAARETRGPALVIFAVIACHLLLSNLAADFDRRHLVPIEPLMWSLVAAAAGRWRRKGEGDGPSLLPYLSRLAATTVDKDQ